MVAKRKNKEKNRNNKQAPNKRVFVSSLSVFGAILFLFGLQLIYFEGGITRSIQNSLKNAFVFPLTVSSPPAALQTPETLAADKKDPHPLVLLSRDDPLAYRAIRAIIPKEEIDFPPAELKRFFDHCPVTTQVKIIQVPPTDNANADNADNSSGDWILQSMHHGTEKVVGGDEYYVSYVDDASTTLPAGSTSTSLNLNLTTAAAFAHDQGDGTYRLDFYDSSMNGIHDDTNGAMLLLQGRGTLTIHLQYTCDMGRPVHPEKDQWSFGGAINIAFAFENVTMMPPSKPFVPPNRDQAIDLGAYDIVVYHGDSIMRQLANKPMRSTNRQTTNFKQNSYFQGLGSRSAWNMDTLEEMKKQLEPDRYPFLVNHTNAAVILGSAAWDILNHGPGPFNMTSHLQACQLMIDHAHALYPLATLYWRSATAMQVHEVANHQKDWHHFEAIFYASNLRAQDLYERQKKMIEEQNPTAVTFLDFYNATYLAADWLQPGDGRHYTEGCNRKMIDWFYVTPNVKI